jgi:hypothetical protein
MLKKTSLVVLAIVLNGYCSNVQNVQTMSLTELEELSKQGYKGYFVDEDEFLESLVTKENEKAQPEIVANKKELAIEHLIDNNKIVIDTFDKYVQYQKYMNSSEFIKLNFKDLLKVTKYIFNNNLGSKKYDVLKPLLLEESLKYKFVDQEYFKDDVEHMTLNKIDKILNELRGLL